LARPGNVLIIAGPTSVGKSRLAFHLAKRWNTGLISADSRQIYRYMDIGTGKPTPLERSIVPHYMIDIVEPDKTYSAGEYGRCARSRIDKMIKEGKIPIVAGGTGLYIRSLIEGLSPSPPSDPKIKKELTWVLRKRGINYLYTELSNLDPELSKRLHPNDKQRILRAMEVYLITGRRLSDIQKQGAPPLPYKILYILLNRDRDVLYKMINKRVEEMFAQGLVDEVRAILDMGYTIDQPGMQSIGYKYITQYISGKISLNEAIQLMQRDTRRYAKRQITWFKKEKMAINLECEELTDVLGFATQIEYWLEHGSCFNHKLSTAAC